MCSFHQAAYYWEAGPWQDCSPPPGQPACQPATDGVYWGVRRRQVTCRERCGHERASSELYCSSFLAKPEQEQICTQPDCPEDCVVTGYGPWSNCDSCFTHEKSRHRQIIRAPISAATCAIPVSEYQTCTRPQDCYVNWHSNFQYRLSAWSICRPFQDKWSGGGAAPGPVLGKRTRSVDCINANSDTVEERLVL